MDIVFATPIEFLRLPERTYNALIKANVNTVGDLLDEVKGDTLLAIKGMGKKGKEAVLVSLEKHGYTVR